MTTDTAEATTGSALSFALAVCAGVALDWPGWATILVAVLLLGVTAIVVIKRHEGRTRAARLAEQRAFDHEQRQAMAPAPSPPASHALVHIRVPSSMEDIHFSFGCAVRWRAHETNPSHPHANLADLASRAVIDRAASVTVRHHPDDGGVAHVLASALSQHFPDESGQVVAWATDVSVTLDEGATEHLQAMTALRRQRQLHQLRVDNERAVRSYLGEEALATVGSAVVWWLARDESKVREAADLIGSLGQLSAAANNRALDPAFPSRTLEISTGDTDYAADPTENTRPVLVVDGDTASTENGMLPDPEQEGSGLFGYGLVALLDRHGYVDLAARARSYYQVDDWSTGDTADESPGESSAP